MFGAWPDAALGASAHRGDSGASTHPRDSGASTHPRDSGASTHPRDSGASTHQDDSPSALILFLSAGRLSAGQPEDDAIETELGKTPALSTAILSATQGTYKTDQLLLDITQGARVSYSAYSPAYPPALSSLILGAPPSARIPTWPAALRRAKGAPQLLEPGLLASSIPGGGGYAAAYGSGAPGTNGAVVGVASRETVSWPLAADRSGQIAAVSFGSPSTLLPRVAALRGAHRLVVADLPPGPAGYADLRTLVADRPPNELLAVVQSTHSSPDHELLWVSFAGLGPGGQTLTSQTTNQKGLVAAIDIAPTILTHLGLPVPADMRGRPIHTDGPLDSAGLRALKSRLGVISSRRLPALTWLIAAWALLLATARVPLGASRHRAQAAHTSRAEQHGAHAAHTSRAEHGAHAAHASRAEHGARASHPYRAGEYPRRGAWAMRVGALAMLWTPLAMLLPAALEPSRPAEFALIVAVSFALGALTDRLVQWPRAPIAPAVAAILALSIDALAGTQLLVRSLLGPNPEFGARFYGIGNELKSALAVLVFTSVAAALYPAVRSRRAATAMACAGVLLAIVEGSARIGAGVGGVILVSAGTAVATAMLLPGSINRKRVLLAMAAPAAALVALAILDLLTAHGGGHFTGSVLDARSAMDIRDIVVRRYGAAYDELRNHLMPVATALALLASIVAVRRRERLLTPVASDPAWLAALAGGLTAGVIGTLTEDSGPVLLVVAVFVLACVLSYLWGRPVDTTASEGP